MSLSYNAMHYAVKLLFYCFLCYLNLDLNFTHIIKMKLQNGCSTETLNKNHIILIIDMN